MKLVKNTKRIKYCSTRGSVQSTFRRAINKAEEQGWSKIIIIGQGRDSGSWQLSNMLDITAVGMLEKAKKYILEDDED